MFSFLSIHLSIEFIQISQHKLSFQSHSVFLFISKNIKSILND